MPEQPSQPLADRLRPQDLGGFLGQEALLHKVRSLLATPRMPSLCLYGPPGCGKSTLALLLAKATGREFIRISAPETGVSQLRRALKPGIVLILDEIHRFSKAQQDFFLPSLESGELTLIATTTENPSFSVTRQLLSRLHLLRLNALPIADLIQLGSRAAQVMGLTFPDDMLRFLASQSSGDGRALLNLVEFAASLPPEQRAVQELMKALPEAVARHDKQGDSHYELASALIKSIRGSDADAALYYLACLLEGGEDPRFICRRLILSASEDIGLADPHALPLAVSCQQAVEFVGMPEGFIPLAETVTYLALAKKSNSSYAAYLNAVREIRQNGIKPVPLHLRNASTGLQKAWGYGQGYKYPHNYREGWVAQEYLPEETGAKRFYQPRTNGAEPALATWWRKLHNIKDNQ